MPLTAKGEEILASMKSEYGAEKGERVFYASKNAGKISGVDSDECPGCGRVECDCAMNDAVSPSDLAARKETILRAIKEQVDLVERYRNTGHKHLKEAEEHLARQKSHLKRNYGDSSSVAAWPARLDAAQAAFDGLSKRMDAVSKGDADDYGENPHHEALEESGWKFKKRIILGLNKPYTPQDIYKNQKRPKEEMEVTPKNGKSFKEPGAVWAHRTPASGAGTGVRPHGGLSGKELKKYMRGLE